MKIFYKIKRKLYELKKCISWFWKKYRWIAIGTLFCIWILIKSVGININGEIINKILRFVFSKPKNGTVSGNIFEIFKNLAYSYIAAMIFFLFQIVIPNKEKEDSIEKEIREYNEDIKTYMQTIYANIIKATLEEDVTNYYEDNTIQKLYEKQEILKENIGYKDHILECSYKITNIIYQCKTLYIEYISKENLELYKNIEKEIVEGDIVLYLKGIIVTGKHEPRMLLLNLQGYKDIYRKISSLIEKSKQESR
ncbi:MAG: hypothetical protein MSR29_00825 [Lachnospiraceae bacterium]|nr:hypothetical protein [Lachnospiraceae bacterium]